MSITEDTKYCKFSHRRDNNYNRLYINQSVDFSIVIITSGICTVWWVSCYGYITHIPDSVFNNKSGFRCIPSGPFAQWNECLQLKGKIGILSWMVWLCHCVCMCGVCMHMRSLLWSQLQGFNLCESSVLCDCVFVHVCYATSYVRCKSTTCI